MYKIYCKNHFLKRLLNYEQMRINEAFCRAMRLDYEVTFPDGSIQKCKFIK